MAVSKQATDQLRDKCGLSAKDCRAALEEHGSDVDTTLAALIDAGRVTSDQLNPETVSDELFERAARRAKLEMYRKVAQPGFGLTGMIAKLGASEDPGGGLRQIAEQLRATSYGDKTPEQLMEEDETKAQERQKQAAKLLPGVKPMSAGEWARLQARTTRRSEYLKEHPLTLISRRSRR